MPSVRRRRRSSRLAQGAHAGAQSIAQVLQMLLQRQYGQQITQENATFQQRLQQENARLQQEAARETARLQSTLTEGRGHREAIRKGEADPGSLPGQAPSLPRRIAAEVGEIGKATSPETLSTVPELQTRGRAQRLFFDPLKPEEPTLSQERGPTGVRVPAFAEILGAREAKKRTFPEIAAGEEVAGEGLLQQPITRIGRLDPDTGVFGQTRTQPKGGTVGQAIEAANLTKKGTRPEEVATMTALETARRRVELDSELRKYGGLLPHVREAAHTLSDDFVRQALPFVESEVAFTSLVPIAERARRGDPVAGVALVFRWYQTTEPTGIVRESEAEMLRATTDLLGRATNKFAELTQGRGFLNPTQVNQMVASARDAYLARRSLYRETVQEFTEKAALEGVPPQLVVKKPSIAAAEALIRSTLSGAATTTPINPSAVIRDRR